MRTTHLGAASSWREELLGGEWIKGRGAVAAPKKKGIVAACPSKHNESSERAKGKGVL